MTATSSHYEVVFSTFLKDSTPPEVLRELRWHLGLSADRPERPAVGDGQALLMPDPNSQLPGGDRAKLERQLRWRAGDRAHHAWGLHARLLWPDDDWARYWWQLACWLSPYVDQDGYAGFFREEFDEQPTLFFVREGQCWYCAFGAEPARFNQPAGEEGTA